MIHAGSMHMIHVQAGIVRDTNMKGMSVIRV
jgi:hypothetical protein